MKEKMLAVLVALFAIPATSGAEVAYVGQGRYACSGKSFECAQVDLNNRSVTEAQRRQYQEERERAQAYVERSRREEKERREKSTYETTR